jgi:hypothetical protein
MNRRLKKLIGTALLVGLVPIYALLVASVGTARLSGTSTITQLAFFAFFGLVWIFPAGLIIKWMATPGAGQSDR